LFVIDGTCLAETRASILQFLPSSAVICPHYWPLIYGPGNSGTSSYKWNK